VAVVAVERRPAPAAASDRTGRDGALGLVVERRGARSVVVAARQVLPLQVMTPLALDSSSAVVSVLNPTGGLVGGDRLSIDVEVRAGARACVTTPSATRVYRTTRDPAIQSVTLRVAEGATLDWVPDHTIPFAGSAFTQRIQADVAEGAGLVVLDGFAAGRVARGERWAFARLESALLVRDAAGDLLRDRFVLASPEAQRWNGLGLAESFPYFATMVVIGDTGVDAWVRAVDAIARSGDGASVAAACLPRRGALARILARAAPDLTDVCERMWTAARTHVLGAPPLALRKP
jgi:urease accessory protein